jgi:hypothetical protein
LTAIPFYHAITGILGRAMVDVGNYWPSLAWAYCPRVGTLRLTPAAAPDRARLSTLGSKDEYLALTKAHYDNIRANITYSRLDSRGRGRVQLAADVL